MFCCLCETWRGKTGTAPGPRSQNTSIFLFADPGPPSHTAVALHARKLTLGSAAQPAACPAGAAGCSHPAHLTLPTANGLKSCNIKWILRKDVASFWFFQKWHPLLYEKALTEIFCPSAVLLFSTKPMSIWSRLTELCNPVWAHC